jgi:hypothetical protein
MHWMKLLLLNCLVILCLLGCAGQPAQPQQLALPTVPPPSADTSVVTGKVVGTGNQAPIKRTFVYLAKVFWDKDHTHAAYALDLANSPVAKTDQNGFFTMIKVQPFEYVVVVGDYYGTNDAVRESNGDAKVYKTEAGKALDVGTVQVNPAVEMP